MRTESPPTRVLSPELALVDADLAAWARLRLQEEAVAAEVAAAAAVEAPLPAGAEPGDRDGVEPDRRPRSLVPLAIATAAAAAIIAAVAVALRPSSDDSAKRAVATPTTVTPTVPAATTPTTAPPTTPAETTTPAKPAPTTTTATTAATATQPKPAATPTTAAPPKPTAAVPFAWPGVTGASAYVFTLSRGPKVIYRAKTTAEQLALKRSWTYGGQRYRLTRGAYRWHVIALVKSEPHGTRTVISAPFWIDRDR
jgi:hypothetical protein